MMIFRSLALGLLGALVLLELAQLHTHLHDRDTQPRVVIISDPAPTAGECCDETPLDNTVIVDVARATVESHLERTAFMTGARFWPHMVHGEPQGVMVSAVQPGSIFAILGFEDGDILRRVNDVPILESTYQWSFDEPALPGFLDLEIVRAGEPLRIVVLLH